MYSIQAKGSISPLNGPQSLNRRTCLLAGGAFLAQLAGCGGGGGDLGTTTTPVHVNGGVVSTLSGDPVASWGLVFNASGNLFVNDYSNHVILQRTPAGVFTTFAGIKGSVGQNDSPNATFDYPNCLTMDKSGNFYVTDYLAHTIRKITPAGEVSTFAGQAYVSGVTNGNRTTQALFNQPNDMVFDSTGNLFVADFANHTIRKIKPDGEVSTFVGTPGVAGFKDGKQTAALFNAPNYLAIDASGNLYATESNNHTIRKITPEGDVSLWAGQVVEAAGVSAGVEGYADGHRLSAALFSKPQGLLLDAAGTMYVADSGNDVIRKISTDGVVSTLAGKKGSQGSNNGTKADAQFDFPTALALKANGEIYIASDPILQDAQGVQVVQGIRVMT